MEALPIPEDLKHIEQEIATYYRELPRMLADGGAGRIALVKGDKVIQVFDTLDDAAEMAANLYGFDPHLIQSIDPRDERRLAPYFPSLACPAASQ